MTIVPSVLNLGLRLLECVWQGIGWVRAQLPLNTRIQMQPTNTWYWISRLEVWLVLTSWFIILKSILSTNYLSGPVTYIHKFKQSQKTKILTFSNCFILIFHLCPDLLFGGLLVRKQFAICSIRRNLCCICIRSPLFEDDDLLNGNSSSALDISGCNSFLLICTCWGNNSWGRNVILQREYNGCVAQFSSALSGIFSLHNFYVFKIIIFGNVTFIFDLGVAEDIWLVMLHLKLSE